MVRVRGSSGKLVNVNITGIAETKKMLEAKKREILKDTDLALLQASNFVQQEVQESMLGNRAEKKSVDSGLLANSISVKKEKNSVIIFPDRKKYPNSMSNTEDVAKFLEFGTSKLPSRHHFKNTRLRTESKVKEIFKKEIL